MEIKPRDSRLAIALWMSIAMAVTYYINRIEWGSLTPHHVNNITYIDTIRKRACIPDTDTKRLEWKEYAYHFMKKYEWLRLQAYPDTRRRSIGYGTASYPWENITEQEAERRYKEAINPRSDKIDTDYPNANSCQKGALISLLYNCPSCYRRIQYKGISERLRLAHSHVCNDWKCEYRPWLHERRVAEWKLYTMCDWDI